MSTSSIVLIVVIAVVAVALVCAVVALRQARMRRGLKTRFGPEYDRTVEASDSPRQANADLRQRAKERDSLDLRPLNPSARTRYRQEWTRIQEEFVDVPESTLPRADGLITEVMVARGYPMKDFESQADLISVDHPLVVQNYRNAHATFTASQQRDVSTEQIRQAFVAYRSLFQDLLDDGPEGENASVGARSDDPGAGGLTEIDLLNG